MMWLRPASELRVGLAAAATVGSRSTAAVPSALLQAHGYAKRGSAGAADQLPKEAQQVQPFSVAMKQLEEVLTEPLLPAEALKANRSALKAIKQFASSLENPHQHPPIFTKVVQVTFRDPYAEGLLKTVKFQLRTTGGDCSKYVQRNWGLLLRELGLPPHFFFDGQQFKPAPPPRPPRPAIVPKPRPATAARHPLPKEKVEAVRQQAAAAGFPSQTISEKQFQDMQAQSEASRQEKEAAAAEQAEQESKIKRLQPLLEAVAALPWIAAMKDPLSQEKVPFIKSQVMDELESWGWDLRGPVRQMWLGERKLDRLVRGKDGGTQLVIKTCHFYVVQNDKKWGLKTYQPTEAAATV